MVRDDGRQVTTAVKAERRQHRALEIIALFKFGKAILFVMMGLGALQLVRPDVVDRAYDWASALTIPAGQRLAVRAIAWVSGQSPRRLHLLGIGAFAYAILFLTEGTGLWLGKRWAEYLTVIATSSLIPLELFELTRHFTATRILALVINLVVVAYLLLVLRRGQLAHGGEGA